MSAQIVHLSEAGIERNPSSSPKGHKTNEAYRARVHLTEGEVDRIGIGRMIERAGETAGLPFGVHVPWLRYSTGYALAALGHGYAAATAFPLSRQHHEYGALHGDVAGAVPRHLAAPLSAPAAIADPLSHCRIVIDRCR